MTNDSGSQSLLIYSRIAGVAYVIIIMLGIFSVDYVESSIVVPGRLGATTQNIASHDFLFRIGIASELFMYGLVVVLSVSLYVILKSVDANLALLAMLWRVGEAIIGGTTIVLGGLIPLLLVTHGGEFDSHQLHLLVGLFLDIRGAGLEIVLFFVGVGGTLFCYLFFRSTFVPKLLAGWGIFTYVTMVIVSLVSILAPDVSETIKGVFFLPGGLFELLFGLWLLVKGIR